jgi:hypothetical protein
MVCSQRNGDGAGNYKFSTKNKKRKEERMKYNDFFYFGLEARK